MHDTDVDGPSAGHYFAGTVSGSSGPSSSRAPQLQKGMWEVTWPLLLSLALSLSLHFVDGFFLSRVSDRAAGAVGTLFPLLGAAIVLFSAVGQAGASVASQLIGARRHVEAPVAYLALIVFNLVVGLGTSAFFFGFHGQLPELLGLGAEGASYAKEYLALLGGLQFLKAVQVAYANILMSRGETRWVLVEALVTNVCNMGLNAAFLNGAFGLPKLGVQGVALATVISLAVGLGFTMCVVHLRFRIRLPLGAPWRELWARMKTILNIGLPSALEPISYQAMQMAVNTLVISWGAAALAARVYVFNFVIITTILWGIAFGVGTQILIAHRIGARSFDDAGLVLKRGLAFAIVGNLVISVTLAVFHRPLLAMLTEDPAVHAHASPLFLIGILVEPARAANIVVGGALRSSGDARYTSTVGVLLMWLVGVPACYFFGNTLGWGLAGVGLAFALDETVRGIVNYRRWRGGRWKELGVLMRRPVG